MVPSESREVNPQVEDAEPPIIRLPEIGQTYIEGVELKMVDLVVCVQPFCLQHDDAYSDAQ